MKGVKLAMRLAFTFLIGLGVLWGQGQPQNYEVTASTTAVTIQANTIATGKTIQGGVASVYCASAQTATISWNGTNATATAGTVLKLPGTREGARATVWTGSNVGGGTGGPVYNVPAGAPGIRIDFKNFFLAGDGGTAQNFTIKTDGTCTITMAWSEK